MRGEVPAIASGAVGLGASIVVGMTALPPIGTLKRAMSRHMQCGKERQYFLEISISEDKDNYYGRVHCNDEPKQNPSLSTQPLYFIAGLSEFL